MTDLDRARANYIRARHRWQNAPYGLKTETYARLKGAMNALMREELDA